MDTHLAIHNKSLITAKKSRRSTQGLRTLGITKKTYYAIPDRTRERYKKVGDRMRERYRKSKGRPISGRKRRRRTKRRVR